MKVVFQYAAKADKTQLFLEEAKIRKLMGFLKKKTKKLAEFKETVSKIGFEPGAVGLCFCDDEYMRQTQKMYRDLNRTTDVLSFPTSEMGSEGIQQFSKEESSFGDILISLPAVARGAKRGKRTKKLELVDVITHAWLHLLGFDHVGDEKGAQHMFTVQKSLFKEFKKEV